MSAEALVEETPVWLEINSSPAVTWMCTPDQLEELVVGWMRGEGYLEKLDDLIKLRPCATELGFWADVAEERVKSVNANERKQVLASGCGAVPMYLAEPASVKPISRSVAPPEVETLRRLFKNIFQRGERYRDTGGIHAAALTDGTEILYHAEDIGRHNAVDKVIGASFLDERNIEALGMLVTGRISAELAYKAARSGLAYIATPSVPSTLAADIAKRAGMSLVGRAVSGSPQLHLARTGDNPV